jgi:hypothetical protein
MLVAKKLKEKDTYTNSEGTVKKSY